MDLSNFYKDNTFNYSNFEILFQVYKDLIEAVNEYVLQVKNNVVIPNMETYRIFPLQRIPVAEGTYNLDELLADPKVVDKYALASTPLLDRVTMWEDGTFTLNEKLDILDVTKKYIPIEAKRGFVGEKDYSVVDFKMFDDSDTEVFRNSSYALNLNRIYLLGDMAVPSEGKHVVIKDISVDFNTPTEILSKSLDLKYNEVLTKNEYNDIIKILTAAALGGPTLASLKAAIETISGPDQGDLYDKFVRNAKKQARWRNTDYKDFDFIVVFPEEYASNLERLQIISDYLSAVKPAYTKFYIILQSIYSDIYNILLNANDADNMDNIIELVEEDINLNVSEEVLDNLRETIDEVYVYDLDYARLNSPYRINVNFKLFGSDIPEQDPHTDTLIPV